MIFYYDQEMNVYKTQMEAMMRRHDNNFFFYYHDDIFNKFDWTTEPSESLEELNRIRAQEIRDLYDYVILCYSGGHDSTNVLETFYYNKIHIDEIVMVGSFSQDPNQTTDENRNAEIYLNCFPTLKNMDLPKTKISLVDYSEFFRDTNDLSLLKNHGNEWIRHVGVQRSAFNIFWHDFKQLVGAKNEKKTCYVFGCDKLGYTKILKDGKKKSCFRINDAIRLGYGGTREMENYKRVDFYISPETTSMNIMKKQAHILHRCEQLGLFEVGMSRDLWEPAYERIIYANLKNQINFESTKAVYSDISGRDNFIWNRAEGTDIHKLYVEGLKDLSSFANIPPKPVTFSRPYFIE